MFCLRARRYLHKFPADVDGNLKMWHQWANFRLVRIGYLKQRYRRVFLLYLFYVWLLHRLIVILLSLQIHAQSSKSCPTLEPRTVSLRQAPLSRGFSFQARILGCSLSFQDLRPRDQPWVSALEDSEPPGSLRLYSICFFHQQNCQRTLLFASFPSPETKL